MSGQVSDPATVLVAGSIRELLVAELAELKRVSVAEHQVTVLKAKLDGVD